MKRIKQLVVLAGLVTMLLPFGADPVGAGPRNSPDGQVEIVTVNLQEAYSRFEGDLGSHFEIPNFVDRVISKTPYFPDVLLLQEVNYETSGLVAREMTRRTGQRYVVAVRPIRNTTIEYPDKAWHTETAIVINVTQMRVVREGAYYAALYPSSATAPGERIQVRRQAHVLVKERSSGIHVPLVSVHFARTADMASKSVSNHWRGEWAEDIGQILERRYNARSGDKLTNIGGDFNMIRCFTGQFASCRPAAYWKVFTSRPHNLIDTLYEHGLPDGVDRIFSAGRVVRGGWDKFGKFRESDRERYYSDHRFRWVVVAPEA